MDSSDLPLTERLNAALALQRAAYHARPVPTYAERYEDLKRLQALLRERGAQALGQRQVGNVHRVLLTSSGRRALS